MDDLRRVAADAASTARERLRADIEQDEMDTTPFAGILSGEVDAEMARHAAGCAGRAGHA